MLEGKSINLRVAQKEDTALLAKWLNDAEFQREYQDSPEQVSKSQLEKRLSEPATSPMQWVDFMVEKKEGTKVGWMCHYVGSQNFGWVELVTP